MSVRAHPSCMHMHTTSMHMDACLEIQPKNTKQKTSKKRKLTTYHASNTNIRQVQVNTSILKHLKHKINNKNKGSEEPKFEPLP